MRVIISGGGTGGHVYPAISIANAIKEICPEAKILFIGAEGKLEMEKVPLAGYPIKGLWISGLQRKLTFKNLLFPIKVIDSLIKAGRIIKEFQPDVVVGVGGYASGPTLRVATKRKIPTVIQEQNSFPGITNRLLAKKVDKICVAYDGMERFFPKEKIIHTGNPIRAEFFQNLIKKRESAIEQFGLDKNLKTVFVFGGSLGAKSINEAMAFNYERLKDHPEIQIYWQVGKIYYDDYHNCETAKLPNVKVTKFVDRMDHAYAIADVIVCRAGASTISELCMVGKPAILIPSPNVAEDHQTKNALALFNKNAAKMINDDQVKNKLVFAIVELLNNTKQQIELANNIKKLAKPEASIEIARLIEELSIK